MKPLHTLIGLLLAAACAPAMAQPQSLHGHVPPAVSRLKPAGRLPSEQRLELVIGLPLRNQNALSEFIQEVYDPASTNFHHFLTPPEFTARFGPTEADYQQLIQFARTNGLTISGTHPGRTLLDVNGRIADIEKTFHVVLHTYQHPTESRTFYAPDTEPVIDSRLPVLHVSGLENYTRSKPHAHGQRMASHPAAKPNDGSARSGVYWGYDFRMAYLPGVTLTGTGQTVALYELEGYNASDIVTYENFAKLPNVPLQNVPIKGFNFVPNFADTNGTLEVALDIEVAIALAPGLSKVIVYGATNGYGFDQNILQKIADDNSASQISSSWGIHVNASIDQICLQYQAQGQSFFMAAGDSDAYVGSISEGNDDPNFTVVGGTELKTDYATNWLSEAVWNFNNSGPSSTTTNVGSSGGSSTVYPIPSWQRQVSMSANQGSTTYRNIPDVAMVADNVTTVFNGLYYNTYGTSIAAPLWAAFIALVNQQAAADGRPRLGFLNPTLYALGTSAHYAADFHDITVGNNTNSISPNQFRAVPGYDLCTGWGSPTTNLIHDLESYAGPVWVDFSAAAGGNGTYDHPYNTLALGINNVTIRGTVAIKGPNSTTAVPSPINKPMVINAAGGAVSIGR